MNKNIQSDHKEESDLVSRLKENLDRYMRGCGYSVNVEENRTTYSRENSQLILNKLTQTGFSFDASVNGYHTILTDFERAYHKSRKRIK